MQKPFLEEKPIVERLRPDRAGRLPAYSIDSS
jgi:hypothetical protein